jgi:uncharacterized protein (DUF2126 family)
MGIQVALKHSSRYRYQRPITLGPQTIQLRPALHCRTPILNYELKIEPAEHLVKWQLDPHMNRAAQALFPAKTQQLAVTVDLVADLIPINPFDFLLDPGFENFPFSYTGTLARDLEPWLGVEAPSPGLKAFLGTLATTRTGTVDFILLVNRKVRDEITYITRYEHGIQSCEETLTQRSGSCRDTAWLLVQLFRWLGIAARFVSGYLIQLAPDTASPDDATPLLADHAELHAWAEVFLPGAGWVGLDPTSGQLTSEGHIPLACTPEPAQAAPIRGTHEPGEAEFEYSFTVRRIHEPRKPSKPLSDEEWGRVRAVAHAIDNDLTRHDVRLTMGGEPTFVGIDDPESPQWNLDAHGPLKRNRGMALVQALRKRMGNGALLHYGMGKWYPGEPLPRWILSCYWRIDGVPVWEDGSLIAEEGVDYGYGAAEAARFMEALTQRLGVESSNILRAFEPPVHSGPASSSVSVGGTRLAAKRHEGATSSARGSAVAESEEEDPAGYVLPIRRRQPNGKLTWSSQLWFPKPDRLELSAGDSPVGFRIPVEAIPWVAPDELKYEMDAAPFSDKARLPRLVRRMESFARLPEKDMLPAVTRPPETAPVLVRSALCVQACEGRLHVFLPFVEVLADYLDLIAATEDTCRYLRMPVWLEGYAPTPDLRMHCFSATPDPGVLEINLPPAKNWDELEAINTMLDDEARLNRLTTSKFAIDGSHRSTGGGSHIVIGGPSLPDSPLLRRPDLLRSMLAFWQNHPALSYLFSGTYVGPTSQYPRVDEARSDSLYELEVSFHNLTDASASDPVAIDGLFRNLLADLTGNTHRAEFCVDKLYPPDGLGLKLGLLELRAFEMAPHVRMNLLQMLLIRGVVAMFWKQPYEHDLIRWGTALHDRFMLPAVIRQDLKDVLKTLRGSGFAFEDCWFDAHLEFRFPLIGSIAADGVRFELRRALEPWNVLAEESVSGSTVRSVDSSLERVQVALQGYVDRARYIVTCNGRRVPLQPCAEPGTLVAGVRYRARMLKASLHPSIPIHAPLNFELIDALNGRSLSRCAYHVAAPQGHVYSGIPADAVAAEARRAERFIVMEPAVTPAAIPVLEINSEFPGTLDLRIPERELKL